MRAALALALAVAALTGCHREAPTTTPTRCEEDMPCWDCHTMGNRVCGPTDQNKETQP